MQMVFDEIEKLKQQYTDKYVVVEGDRPELARFKGSTGRVKTVNMSGRALVEFDANNNIAWYDIALDFLKIVDKPLPKPAEAHEKPAKKEAPAKPKAAATPAPAAAKKLSPLEMARAQGAAKKAGEAPKKSTSDILAAARGGKAAAPAKAEAPAAKPAAPASKPAAPTAAPKGKLSTADILAAARAKQGAAAEAPAAAAPAAAPPAKAAPKAAAARGAPAEPEPAPVVAEKKPAPAKSSGAKLGSTAEKIAWCRQHDAK